jgi:dTDP-4-dehydrorhamnose reductase
MEPSSRILRSGKAQGKGGIYHYANEGVCSWYDFAKAIFDLSGLPVKVLPILSREYPTPASRPSYSVLDKTKFKETFGIEIPYWRDSLADCIREML